MCLWTTFSLFICITTSVLAQQEGGSLRCPSEWIKGEKVKLEFLINESLFPKQCGGGSDNRPYFQRKPSASGLPMANCTVPDITANCSFVSDALGCGCVTKNGSYVVQYNFIAHPDYNGWWSVDLACVDSVGSQQLTFSTASQCNDVDVKDGPCDGFNCTNGGSCYVNDNEATCNCNDTFFYGDLCEKNACQGFVGSAVCTIWSNDPTTAHYICDSFFAGPGCKGITATGIGIIVVAIVLAIVFFLGFIVGFVCGYRMNLNRKVCVLAKNKNIGQTLTSKETKRRIRVFIKKNFVCCCRSIDVDIGANCAEDGLVTIMLKHRFIWFYWLQDMPSKVEEFIKTEILPEVQGNEPAADYSPGPPMSQPKYTGKGNGQPKKSKSNKEIPLSTVGRSSPPSETSGDEKTLMIPTTKTRDLPVPANQHEPTSIGIGKSASPRLDPLKQDHSKMTSVERNSGAFSRELPSPVRSPLGPIPSGKQS